MMTAIVKLILVINFLPYIFVAWIGAGMCLLELIPLAWYVRDSKTRLPIRRWDRAKLPQIYRVSYDIMRLDSTRRPIYIFVTNNEINYNLCPLESR